MSNGGTELYKQARRRIPGGTQLLSKRPEMFLPEQWPAYYSRASGAEIWDMDGRRFVDMTIGGIGACVLGYADPNVDDAVREAIGRGVATSLNCPEEPALADLLCELHPWADMVRYLRCGGEAMAAGVRIARARTRKDKIVFCGYHGWHDWYLSANLAHGSQLDGHLLPGLDPAGVPRALAGTAIPFTYNDLAGLEKALAAAGDGLAAIVMEPIRAIEPAPGFLERVRDEAHRRQALLVFDEVSAGFRLNTGGAHLTLGVDPDIAVFAKAIGNGYPMAAVIGTGDAMQAAQGTFVSSTNWTERTGPAAALATLAKHRRLDVGPRLVKQDIASRPCGGRLPRMPDSPSQSVAVCRRSPASRLTIRSHCRSARYSRRACSIVVSSPATRSTRCTHTRRITWLSMAPRSPKCSTKFAKRSTRAP